MFRYFIQQFLFQIVALTAAVLVAGLFFYARAVEKNDPPPADVKVQFQNSLGKPMSPVAPGTTDVSVQHLSEQEMSSIVNTMVAECLSFSPADYDRNLPLLKNYFTPEGYQQYLAYLQQSKLGDVVKSQKLQSGAYAERPPLEVNSMAQNGVYKWLYEIPVTVGFVSVNTHSYRTGETRPQNQRFTLRLQLTRVKDPANPNAVRIEIWQVLPARK